MYRNPDLSIFLLYFELIEFGGAKMELQEREVTHVEELWILTVQILIFHRINYSASKNGNM